MIAQLAIGVAPHLLRQFAPQIIAQAAKRGLVSTAGKELTKGLVGKQIASNIATKAPVNALMDVAGAEKALRKLENVAIGGQFLAEMGFQEQQQMADLIERGYTPEEAKQEVKKRWLQTAARASFEPLATKALLGGKLPGSAAKAAVLQMAGGAYQGLESGFTRDYGLGGILGEAAAGAALGAVPAAIDTLPYLPYKRFFKSKVQEQ